MGESTRKKKVFLSKHQFCAFCGGENLATTIEHCPPRSLFRENVWPEHFEFPACHHCNNGSSATDLLVSILARMDPITPNRNPDNKFISQLSSANRRLKGLVPRMRLSATAARRVNNKYGIRPAPGCTHLETGAVNLPPEFGEAVGTLARKLFKGLYYRDVGRIFPSSGSIMFHWFTNAELFSQGSYAAFDILSQIASVTSPIERSGKSLEDQFTYTLSVSGDGELTALQASFGYSFGFIVIASTSSSFFEDLLNMRQEEIDQDGVFQVLQDPN